jgi:prefoldin subunit 5
MNSDECAFDDSTILDAIDKLRKMLDEMNSRLKKIEQDVTRIKNEVRSR